MKTPLFLVIGDPFLRAGKIKTLTADIEKQDGRSLAQQSFRVRETALADILSAARTLPFLAEAQILYIRDAQELKDPDLAVLSAYLENPAVYTCLILEVDDLPLNAELAKLAKSKGEVLRLKETELKTTAALFLQQKLNRAQKTITPGAKTRLLEMCGDAVTFLDTMLERLIQYAGEKHAIDEEMVSQFEEHWSSIEVYQLTKALLDQQPQNALKVFRELIEQHDADLISLIGLLHSKLRQLWQAKVLTESGLSEAVVLERCKVSPKAAVFFLKDLRKFSLKKIESALEGLYQIDQKAKSGLIDGLSGLEAWLLAYAA